MFEFFAIILRLPFFLLGVSLWTLAVVPLWLLVTSFGLLRLPFVFISAAWDNNKSTWEYETSEFAKSIGPEFFINPYRQLFQWFEADWHGAAWVAVIAYGIILAISFSTHQGGTYTPKRYVADSPPSGQAHNPSMYCHRFSQQFFDFCSAYARKGEKKALAFAKDSNGAWSAGDGAAFTSQDEANSRALKECEKRRPTSNVHSRCRLYAIGTTLVWKDW